MHWHSFIRTVIRSYTPVWVVLLAGVTLTVVGSARLRQQRQVTDQARFDRAVQQTVGTIRDRMRHYGLAASSLADFFAARDSVSQPEWRFRLQALALEQNYPGLLEAGFAALEPSLSNAPPVSGGAGSVQARPPSASPFRVVHAWVRPPSAMSGVDPEFLAEPDQAAVAWQALTSSSVTLSGVRQLSAEVEGEPARGFSIFAPVFHAVVQSATNRAGSVQGENGDDRVRHPRGVSFCAIQPDLLLEALFGMAPREVGFELFGQGAASGVQWLNPSAKAPRALDPTFRAYIKTNVAFQVLSQTWSVHCYTTPLFEREASFSRPWLVLPLGLGLTFALSGLLAIQIHARVRQGAVAAELKLACDDLQHVQNERERVSRELHDGAIQSLYLLQLTLGRCERLLRSNAAHAREILTQGRSGIDDLISELRRFLLHEDAKPGEMVGFEEAHAGLQGLVLRLRKAESARIQLTAKSSARVSLTTAQLGHLKRIAQEAMSNSLRHSHAKTLRVALGASDSAVRLVIVDDGCGFEPPGAAATGNGLANMQARAAHLGGTLEVKSSAGCGTSVTLVFPATPTSDIHHEQAHPH